MASELRQFYSTHWKIYKHPERGFKPLIELYVWVNLLQLIGLERCQQVSH